LMNVAQLPNADLHLRGRTDGRSERIPVCDSGRGPLWLGDQLPRRT
jgi:hypothetical protein